MIKGFTQKYGIDFFDTYSPITKISIIALAANISNGCKTTFLNGDLNEQIYMKQPEGCVVFGQEHKVFKLRKSLYHLKQTPKQWYEKFNSTLIEYSFIVNTSDMCVLKVIWEWLCYYMLICRWHVDIWNLFGCDKLNKIFFVFQIWNKGFRRSWCNSGNKNTKIENVFFLN